MSEENNVPAVIPFNKAQKKLLDEMTVDTKALAMYANKVQIAMGKGTAVAIHSLGLRIAEATQDEARFGSTAIEQLANFLGTTATVLYSYRSFATLFSIDTVQEYQERHLLTVAHWCALTKIKEEPARMKMLEKTIKENYSAAELINLIRSGSAGAATNNRSSTGRNVSPPRSIQGGLQKFQSSMISLSNILPVTEQHVFEAIEGMDTDLIDEKFLKNLETAYELTNKNAESLAADADVLQAKIKYVQGVLESKEEVDSDTEESDKPKEKPAKAKAGGKGKAAPAPAKAAPKGKGDKGGKGKAAPAKTGGGKATKPAKATA